MLDCAGERLYSAGYQTWCTATGTNLVCRPAGTWLTHRKSAAYALAILEGVKEAAWQLGVDLVLSAVVGRTKHGQPPPAWLADHGIPAVVVEPRRAGPPGLPVVASTNLTGPRAATEHLIGLGHERIAIMTGRPGVPCAKERLVGYRKAMAAGLRIDPRWETCGYFQMEDALRAARAMLDELPEPPTTVFACSDAMALGVYHPGGPVQHRSRLKVSRVTSRFTSN